MCVDYTVVCLSLVPGLRKKGILQLVTDKIKAAIGGAKKGVQETKPKTN